MQIARSRAALSRRSTRDTIHLLGLGGLRLTSAPTARWRRELLILGRSEKLLRRRDKRRDPQRQRALIDPELRMMERINAAQLLVSNAQAKIGRRPELAVESEVVRGRPSLERYETALRRRLV